jgi:hypothetical protein
LFQRTNRNGKQEADNEEAGKDIRGQIVNCPLFGPDISARKAGMVAKPPPYLVMGEACARIPIPALTLMNRIPHISQN